jgi:hypothetical protein
MQENTRQTSKNKDSLSANALIKPIRSASPLNDSQAAQGEIAPERLLARVPEFISFYQQSHQHVEQGNNGKGLF